MHKALLVFLLLLSFLPAVAEEHFHLVKVLVSGSTRYQAEDLVRATGLQENSTVTRQQLDGGTKRLADSGVFASVDYLFRPASSGSGIEAQFRVKDADKLLPIEFENFVWWSQEELESALHQAVPLYLGKIGMAGTLADEVSVALGTLLAAKGVDSQVIGQRWAAPGELPSAYRIRIAGGVPKVKDVQLIGANHVSADVLARFVESLRNRDYLRSTVQKEIERTLVAVYLESGYLQFRAGDIHPAIAPDKTLTISIAVSEGTQYKLAGYSWSGNTVVPADRLSQFIMLKPGQPVNLNTLRANLDAARKFMGKFGREAAAINPMPTFAGENVTYRFDVSEGDLYRMGDLEIEGLDAAATQKIRDLWKLGPGSPYDNTYLPEFVKRLILRRQGASFTCEFLEQMDETQKLVNIQLQFKAN
jgi:outer membrane protein insertion porin family